MEVGRRIGGTAPATRAQARGGGRGGRWARGSCLPLLKKNHIIITYLQSKKLGEISL